MLDIEVLRYLYKESVKNFIRENNINFNWNENDERLVSLFNTIDNQEKRSFLEREILYGMQRNIYISKIDENINHINDERIAIEIINSFNEYTKFNNSYEVLLNSFTIPRNHYHILIYKLSINPII